jgi:hypothetical protein
MDPLAVRGTQLLYVVSLFYSQISQKGNPSFFPFGLLDVGMDIDRGSDDNTSCRPRQIQALQVQSFPKYLPDLVCESDFHLEITLYRGGFR